MGQKGVANLQEGGGGRNLWEEQRATLHRADKRWPHPWTACADAAAEEATRHLRPRRGGCSSHPNLEWRWWVLSAGGAARVKRVGRRGHGPHASRVRAPGGRISHAAGCAAAPDASG